MNVKVASFIRKFSELLTFPDFKSHLDSYLQYDTEENIVKSIEDGVQKYLFVDTAPWYTRNVHANIMLVVLMLCSYYCKYKDLPFTAQQALADGAADYMDSEITSKVLAVAQTWE